MIAKRTTFANTGATLKTLEAAIATARQDGAQDDAVIYFFPAAEGYTLKAEWEVNEPDPAGPPADTREQPTQVAQSTDGSLATGGVVGEPVNVILHAGEVLVQPDGLIDETPGH